MALNMSSKRLMKELSKVSTLFQVVSSFLTLDRVPDSK